jgi:hypothetical protein
MNMAKIFLHNKKGYITFRMEFINKHLCNEVKKFAIPYENSVDMQDKLSTLYGVDGVKYLRYDVKTISKDRYVMSMEDFLKLY